MIEMLTLAASKITASFIILILGILNPTLKSTDESKDGAKIYIAQTSAVATILSAMASLYSLDACSQKEAPRSLITSILRLCS